MSFLRRITLVLSILVSGSLALAVAVGAAGGGGMGPGDYIFKNTSANAEFGVSKVGPPTSGFAVFVNQGLNFFQPEHPNGPKVVTNSTMVSIQVFTPTGGAFGCFILNNQSDFKVSKDLKTASLHTTLTADETCPGFGAPVTGKADAIPMAGGGGGLTLPMKVDVTWSSLGTIAAFTDRTTFKCLKYSTSANDNSLGTAASAIGTTDALPGTFSADFAGVHTDNVKLDITGVPDPSCFGI